MKTLPPMVGRQLGPEGSSKKCPQSVLSKDDGSNEGCAPGERRGSEQGGRVGLPRGCGRCSKTEAKPLPQPDPEEHTRPQQRGVLQTPRWPSPPPSLPRASRSRGREHSVSV